MPPDAAVEPAGSSRAAPGVAARVLDSCSSRRWLRLLAFAAVVGVCLARALFHAFPVARYSIDILVELDEGWRVFSGQRPHVDFYSAPGPVTCFIPALGMLLARGEAQGLNYATALPGALAAWMFAIAPGWSLCSPHSRPSPSSRLRWANLISTQATPCSTADMAKRSPASF